MYGTAPISQRLKQDRETKRSEALAFGRYAARTTSPKVEPGTAELREATSYGSRACVSFTHKAGPARGSQADECLLTIKPVTPTSGSTGWMTNVLAAEMTEFVEARMSRRGDGKVPRSIEQNAPTPSSIVVDGSLLNGWTIVGHSVIGLGVMLEDRALLWIGLNETRPPKSIFTAEMSSIFIN